MNVDGAIPSCAARAAISCVRTASVTGRFLTEPDGVEAAVDEDDDETEQFEDGDELMEESYDYDSEDDKKK